MNIKKYKHSTLFTIITVIISNACGRLSDSYKELNNSSSNTNTNSNTTTNTNHTPTTMEIYYLNALNGNTAVLMSSDTKFPTDPYTANIGYLYLANYSGFSLNSAYFNFEIRNTGSEPLYSTTDLAISKTTDYTYNSGQDSTQYSFAISAQPIFPIVAGGSSTFTVKLSTPNNTKRLGAYVDNSTYGYTYESARVIIKTNDTNNPTYNLDINVFGSS